MSQQTEFSSHRPCHRLTSVLTQSTGCVAQKLSLSWNESSAQQSVVDVSVSAVLHTHTWPSCLTRPQRGLLIPKQSLRVWACEDCWDALSRFWRLSVGWAWLDSDIRGFPPSERVCGGNHLTTLWCVLTSGLGEVSVRVAGGFCGGFWCMLQCCCSFKSVYHSGSVCLWGLSSKMN